MLKQIVITIFLLTLCWSNIALAASKPKTMPPVFVETTTIQTTSHQDQISSTGSLLSIPGIVVKPEIPGRITKIYFNSGDVVQKGVPLVEINPDIIKATLIQTLAELKLNKLNFERSATLYKTRDISKSDFDQAQANYVSAKAGVDSAQAQLQQTTIVAPFAGKLGLSQVNVGDYVNIGQNIVNLQTLDPLKVDFSIPELYQSKIAVGQIVSLCSDAYPHETFSGKVEAFESLVNTNNRTLNVRANVPNKNGKLIPGGFVEVSLQFAEQQLIMIPQTAIVYDPSGNYVYKVVAGKAEKTAVTLGEKNADNVTIKSGLKVGDVVVTAGQIKMYPGAQVIVAGNKPPGS